MRRASPAGCGGSRLAGRTLQEANAGETAGALVLALRGHDGTMVELSIQKEDGRDTQTMDRMRFHPVLAAALLCTASMSIAACGNSAAAGAKSPVIDPAFVASARRHGTVDLFAALNTATGTVTGRLSAQHRAVYFRDV